MSWLIWWLNQNSGGSGGGGGSGLGAVLPTTPVAPVFPVSVVAIPAVSAVSAFSDQGEEGGGSGGAQTLVSVPDGLGAPPRPALSAASSGRERNAADVLIIPAAIAEPVPPVIPPTGRSFPVSAGSPAGPEPQTREYALPLGFRMGYPDYLRSATMNKVASIALSGLVGLAGFTALGGLIGYRQARAGLAVRAAGTERFLKR